MSAAKSIVSLRLVPLFGICCNVDVSAKLISFPYFFFYFFWIICLANSLHSEVSVQHVGTKWGDASVVPSSSFIQASFSDSFPLGKGALHCSIERLPFSFLSVIEPSNDYRGEASDQTANDNSKNSFTHFIFSVIVGGFIGFGLSLWWRSWFLSRNVEESQGVSEGRANGVETSDWLGVSLSMCYGCLPSLVIYQNNKMCPWRGWCLLFIKHAPSLVSNSVFEMAPSHVVFIDFISLVYYCGFSYFNNLRFL